MGEKELILVDRNITSLLDVPLSLSLTSLDLHCNHLRRIEGLNAACHLRHLDLSSNQISKMEGLSSLASLRSLNLSCNLLTCVEGLEGLVNLSRLSLSFNNIKDLSGLVVLHGPRYQLKQLHLYGNRLEDLDHLLQSLLGVVSLREVTLRRNGRDNPVCRTTGYRDLVLQSLPQLSLLDGLDRLGRPLSPGLSSLDDLVLSSDTSLNQMRATPSLGQVKGSPSSGGRDAQLPPSREMIPVCQDMQDTGPGGPDLQDPGPDLQDPGPGVWVNAARLQRLEQQVSRLSLQQVGGARPVSTPRIDQLLTRFCQQIVSEVATDPGPGFPDLQNPGPGVEVDATRLQRLEQQMSRIILQPPKKPTGPTGSTGPAGSTGSSGSSVSGPVVLRRKPKRDTDRTSESECDSGKENRRQDSKPQTRTRTSTSGKQTLSRTTHSNQDNQNQRRTRSPAGGLETGSRRRSGGPAGGLQKISKTSKTSRTLEEETYRTIVEERDQERERRWRAEQEVRQLTEEKKKLQGDISQEREVQSLALVTTDRLKEVFLKERSSRSELQAQLEVLESRCQTLNQQLEQNLNLRESQGAELKKLQDAIAQKDSAIAQKDAQEARRRQVLQQQVEALRRELDLQRSSNQQNQNQVQQLQGLLASREQEHRKQLEARSKPGWAEFRAAVAKEVESVERRHALRETELEEKVSESRKQYGALEDEFRLALSLEAARFSEVSAACDHVSSELEEVRVALAASQQRDRKCSLLVSELTAVVKEQKERIGELVRAKKDAASQLQSLQVEVRQERCVRDQVDQLKEERSRLVSRLLSQEALLDELRTERKSWGEELARQGASLVQDRGRLESRLEVLSEELQTQKDQIQRDGDTLKIKTKIIQDQTQTIMGLKQGLQQREEELERLKQVELQSQRRNQEEMSKQKELREKLEELNRNLEDTEAELQDARNSYSESSRKWQQKAELLTRLESQVVRMKENFDSKERLLLEERDKAEAARKAAVDRLHCVDDAFRSQLESLKVSHQKELLYQTNEKQLEIQRANQRVEEVEEEMRRLLKEMETKERMIEEKMRRVSCVLQEFNA